jgi:hypothetical protein
VEGWLANTTAGCSLLTHIINGLTVFCCFGAVDAVSNVSEEAEKKKRKEQVTGTVDDDHARERERNLVFSGRFLLF